jgi:hypothetical protein
LFYQLFEKGREFKRGQSPLSTILPSPAMNLSIPTVSLAGEGSGVRLAMTSKKQIES